MKSKEKSSKPKTRNLFDHINEIRVGKNPKYFSTLSEADKKTWSNYMVCRVLSMQDDIVDVINELQYYQDKLQPEQFYQLCISATPKGRGFFPYIKSKSEKYKPELLTILCAHFGDSRRNVVEYINLLPKKDIQTILQKYGYSDSQITEILE